MATSNFQVLMQLRSLLEGMQRHEANNQDLREGQDANEHELGETTEPRTPEEIHTREDTVSISSETLTEQCFLRQ